ncbi:MAG: ABC transporter substrate-binding protein [Alphaproteobacteria bacterium]|nr:ABC transporter substrate-binding protein [Alphaproteobacteria bacterium SS10]
MFRQTAAALALSVIAALPFGAQTAFATSPSDLIEPPSLAKRVTAGLLPPVAERVPATPHVTDMAAMGREPGKSGGRLTMLMSRDKDVRQMVVYGYARLIGYNADFELQPDILERLEVEENRIFTFHLRPGHRWSDGAPFTAEDFRFFWEDVALNEEVNPSGPPPVMRMKGELPSFEVLDETTVRFTWSTPNPMLMHELAAASPLYLYMPSHYLKSFHADYADPGQLQQRVDAASKRSWAALFNGVSKAYKNENPDLPVLQPWILDKAGIGTRKVFRRNPYFHRVDSRGLQLPYLDEVVFTIADAKLIPAKVAAGESDLQARYLRFEDYALLKKSAGAQGYDVALWSNGRGSQLALYPNLTAKDPAWREAFQDVRVRRALSLAIDREEINQVIFFGLGKATANGTLPQSPLYNPAFAEAYAEFNLAKAGKLLDQAGLRRDPNTGDRLLSDGQPMEIIVESAGESTLESDVLLLIRDSYAKLGINLITRPSQRELFRNRVYGGEALMSVWTGLDNGLPTASMAPTEFAPVRQDHLQWPAWGQYYETHGESGEAPSLPEAQRLLELYKEWSSTTDDERHVAVWEEMQQVFAESVFTIGTISQVPQPVVIADHLKNVPRDALYNWDPGGYFGVHRMDLFYRDDAVSVTDLPQPGRSFAQRAN